MVIWNRYASDVVRNMVDEVLQRTTGKSLDVSVHRPYQDVDSLRITVLDRATGVVHERDVDPMEVARDGWLEGACHDLVASILGEDGAAAPAAREVAFLPEGVE
jgi:hypothetical protein